MRRFFRFSIRDLLWLTLVVAMGLGWFMHQRELQAALDQANHRAEDLSARYHHVLEYHYRD